MNIQERFPLKRSIYDNPWTPLNEEESESMIDYYNMLQKMVRMKDNPYRIEIVKHLTRAFFYGSSYQYHKIPDNENKSKQEILVEEFVFCHSIQRFEMYSSLIWLQLPLTPKPVFSEKIQPGIFFFVPSSDFL